MLIKALITSASAALVLTIFIGPAFAQQDKSIYELGASLDGNKTYKLHMPPNVPVKLFWAVTVYDPWTRCEIQSQPYPSISSQQKPAPTSNADGSIDIYFSVEKPANVSKANWVKTLQDQGFFVYMRYYGPLKAFNEKTWIPNDVDLVK